MDNLETDRIWEIEIYPNRALINEICQAFEEIFEHNDYTWDELEFRIAYAQQKKIYRTTCDSNLYTCDKQLILDIHSYFSHYCINDNIRNILPTLNAIIRFDYKRMKLDNENFYIELNKVILKPERIQTMATKHGMDFFDYLDAIMTD